MTEVRTMTGTVKALKWREIDGRHFAKSHGARYEVARFDVDGWCLNIDAEPRWAACGELEAAKAAAQADYERRILSALTASASEPTAPLIEQVDALLALASRDALAPKVPHLALELLRRCRDAVASPVPASEPEPSVADKILREIEERFPNWKGFRDLVDCIDVTLHNLREARPLPAKPEGE